MEPLILDGGRDATLLWTAVVAATMVIGLLGVIVPILPGILLIWTAAVAYGLLVGFTTVGWVIIGILTTLSVASVIKGIIIPRRTAARSGASGWAQLAAVFGGVFGFFIVPVFGLILGALAGLLTAEFLLKGSWSAAWTATMGAAKGFGISALIDLVLGMTMIAFWSIWAASVLL